MTESSPKSSSELKQMFDKKGQVVLLSSIVLTIAYWVLALWYTNKSGFTKDLVVFYAIFGPIFNYNPWLDFWQYIYQFGMTVLLFAVIPYFIVKYYLKESILDYGLRWGKMKIGIALTIILVVLIPIVSYSLAENPDLALEYPLSKLISISWLLFISYESAYFFYFFAYEIMMRGYLQWGLKRESTTNKGIVMILIIQTTISTLFHIGKSPTEMISALAFGPILGYAALKLDSIWYGMIIHFVLNIFNDYFILYWLDMLPTKII